jgi:histidinol-phosphatase (PHP family)
VNQVYRDYFDLLRQCALSGMYDIMAHVDLVKKFGNRPTEDMTDEVRKTAKVFKECGVAVEINTSGLRKKCNEMYPAQNYLKLYCEAGVPLTFGSDSHDPLDVGKDFDKAINMARAVGYTEYCLFKNRKVERTIKI